MATNYVALDRAVLGSIEPGFDLVGVLAVGPAPQPSDRLASEDTHDTLVTALLELGRTERQVLLLATREDLTCREIAERLGISDDLVTFWTRTGLSHLGRALGAAARPDHEVPWLSSRATSASTVALTAAD